MAHCAMMLFILHTAVVVFIGQPLSLSPGVVAMLPLCDKSDLCVRDETLTLDYGTRTEIKLEVTF